MSRSTVELHVLAAGDGLAGFEAWCATRAGGRVRLLASGALWRPLVLAEGLPIRDEEVAGYARGVLAQYYGAQKDGPTLVWRSGVSRGAALWLGPPLAELQAAAARHRVRLIALVPLWWWQWRRALADEPSLARAPQAHLLVTEGAMLTHLELAQGRLVGLRQQRLASADQTALDVWCAAAQLGGLVRVQPGVAGVDGSALAGPLADDPLAESPDLLVPPGQRFRRWGWALAGVAGLTAAVAGVEAWQAATALREAQAELARRPEVHAAAAPTVAPATAAAAARAQALLSHRWGELLAVSEQVTEPGVQWQGWAHAAPEGELQLNGLAPDEATALRLAGQVSARLLALPGWREATATRLQPQPGGGVAFELQAVRSTSQRRSR